MHFEISEIRLYTEKNLKEFSCFHLIQSGAHKKRICRNVSVRTRRCFRLCTQENHSWGRFRFVILSWQSVPCLLYLYHGKAMCKKTPTKPLVLGHLEITIYFSTPVLRIVPVLLTAFWGYNYLVEAFLPLVVVVVVVSGSLYLWLIWLFFIWG